MTQYKVSKYQERIYDWIQNGKGNAVIQAVAGSGKTTTIVQATNLIPKNKKAVFVAFNKAIADELKSRLPSHVEARTLHSLGLSFFRSNNNNIQPQISSTKVNDLVLNEIEDVDENLKASYIPFLKKIISLIKNTMVDYTRLEELEELKERYNLNEVEINDRIMLAIRRIIKANNENTATIDFDDMIYLPVVLGYKNGVYDWVLVDESQDLNKAQFELVKKVCDKQTRVIAVGDKRQSIYAFRGANTNSMDDFMREFNAVSLPLSICYRCPKSHIAMAQQYVPEIEAAPDAKEGTIENIDFEEIITLADDNDKDLVLCRTNAPLIEVAFSLIRNGKKAIIRGKDIGKNLITMIEKYKAKDMGDLYLKLNTFKKLQEEKLSMIEKGKYDSKKKNSILTAIDSIETLFAIMQDCETIAQVKEKIEKIFSDDREGIICSSVHRAKGLQANSVFIVNYEKMPHPMAKSQEEIEQEYNIIYVALTRSKNALYLV